MVVPDKEETVLCMQWTAEDYEKLQFFTFAVKITLAGAELRNR